VKDLPNYIRRPEIRIESKPLAGSDISVLLGIPGSGLVGSIALSYMMDQLKFDQIGGVIHEDFPPFAMMQNGVINTPMRIYQKENFAAVVADFPLHPALCYWLAKDLLDWLAQFSVKEVVSIAGIVTNEPEKRVFGVATTPEVLERIKDLTLILPMGSISGIPASILSECKIRNIPGIGLLGETINAPDPRAAAAAIAVLNKIYGLNLDTGPLIEQATEIEAAMHRISEEIQTSDVLQKKEQLPMYG
jgi:uncharacterized protein